MKLMQWCMICVQAGAVRGLCEKRNKKIHDEIMKKNIQAIHHPSQKLCKMPELHLSMPETMEDCFKVDEVIKKNCI